MKPVGLLDTELSGIVSLLERKLRCVDMMFDSRGELVFEGSVIDEDDNSLHGIDTCDYCPRIRLLCHKANLSSLWPIFSLEGGRSRATLSQLTKELSVGSTKEMYTVGRTLIAIRIATIDQLFPPRHLVLAIAITAIVTPMSAITFFV